MLSLNLKWNTKNNRWKILCLLESNTKKWKWATLRKCYLKWSCLPNCSLWLRTTAFVWTWNRPTTSHINTPLWMQKKRHNQWHQFKIKAKIAFTTFSCVHKPTYKPCINKCCLKSLIPAEISFFPCAYVCNKDIHAIFVYFFIRFLSLSLGHFTLCNNASNRNDYNVT